MNPIEQMMQMAKMHKDPSQMMMQFLEQQNSPMSQNLLSLARANNAQDIEETKATIKAKLKALQNPNIVHCMGKEKWWNCSGIRYEKHWEKYAGNNIPLNRKRLIKINNFVIIRN